MKTNKTKNNISQKPMTTMIGIDTCEWFILPPFQNECRFSQKNLFQNECRFQFPMQ